MPVPEDIFHSNILNSFVGTTLENFITAIYLLYPAKHLILYSFLSIFLLMAPITAIHEAIHGITYIIFGGKVKYGFKGIYAYTMEVSEKPLEITKFLVILLMPVTVISLLSLLLPNWLGNMVYLLNLIGSPGDLFMAFSLIKFDHSCKIIDRNYGFDIVLKTNL